MRVSNRASRRTCCSPTAALTYAVDPMRRLVFNHLDISEAARRTLDPGVTWFGWRVPSLVEVGIVNR